MNNVKTLDDLIRHGKTSSYSINTLSLCQLEDTIVYFDKFAYQKYEKILMGLSELIELTDDQYRLYKYNPERLSYDLYGTSNLYHLILFLNNCSQYEFKHKKVRLIAAKYISNVFEKMINHEEKHIQENVNAITG